MNGNSGSRMQPFSFAVLNDLHYMGPADRPWLERLVRQINQTDGVELCLVLGDLAEHGSHDELRAAKEILAGLQMPCWVVPGNHDGPPGGTVGGAASLIEYELLFPGRRNYTFEHRGWQFVGLDSTQGSTWRGVHASAEMVAFARTTAERLDPQRPVILFTHFPLAPGVTYALVDGLALLKIFSRFHVPIAFSGHYHGLTSVMEDGVEMVTNRCCSMQREIHDGTATRGYFLCAARADRSVTHQFTAYPAAAK